jgi:multimeric flavodoxin WrbA
LFFNLIASNAKTLSFRSSSEKRGEVKMKVVGVVGSPREGGNTEAITRIALEEIQKEGFETELISLAGKRIEPCDGCRACRTEGKCHFKDDFEPIFRKMVKADGIILASPVYFGAATPQVTSLISRFYSKREKPLNDKVGGPIVVGRRAGHNFTFAQLMFFFMIQGMIVPGSTYWNVAFGRSKEEVIKDEEGVNTVKNFAHKLAWVLKKTKAQ